MLNVLASTGQFESKGEIRRLLKQGAIKMDVGVEDLIEVESTRDRRTVIKAGKAFHENYFQSLIAFNKTSGDIFLI